MGMRAALTTAGVETKAITSVSSVSAWTAAAHVVIPELENGDLSSAMDSSVKAAINALVEDGGVLIVGHAGGSYELGLGNSIFGWGLGSCKVDTQWERDESTVGEFPVFGEASELLETVGSDDVQPVQISSIPSGGSAIYVGVNGDSCSAVTVIPHGYGYIILLVSDWYAFSDGWNEVLVAAAHIHNAA